MSAPTLSQADSFARPHQRYEPVTEPIDQTRRPPRTVLAALGLSLILGLFGARCLWIASTDSITSDESTHLVHCLHYWMTGDDLGMWELGAPRLPHMLAALASYLCLQPADLIPKGEGDALVADLTRLVLSGADRVLVPARCTAILSGMALLAAVFWTVARRQGLTIGLVAAGLTALIPEVTAHAAIAGSDLPFTASAFLALLLLARYAEHPSARRWIGVALSIGLAWSTRHTALVLLPMAGLVHLVLNARSRSPRTLPAWSDCVLGSIWATAGLSTIAFLVLWAGDGFGVATVGEVAERVTMVRIPRRLGPLELSAVPIPTSILSILKQIRHQNQGHEAYFLGEFGTTGWPLYFPVAFLLKTPIGLLVLMVLAIPRVRPKGLWDAIALAFLALLWVMLIRNKVNIGARYALLTYPIAAVFIARMFEPAMLRDKLWGPVSVIAALAFAVASLGCGTRCLSYFNEIGGGPQKGWLYLADSNIDWGQDFDALAATIARLGIDEVTTDVSSERRLQLPGVLTITNPGRAFRIPAVTPPDRRLHDSEGGYIPVHTRYVAVSVSRLMGLYSQNDMSWLRTRKVVARVGDSAFLFDLDQPAVRALYEE